MACAPACGSPDLWSRMSVEIFSPVACPKCSAASLKPLPWLRPYSAPEPVSAVTRPSFRSFPLSALTSAFEIPSSSRNSADDVPPVICCFCSPPAAFLELSSPPHAASSGPLAAASATAPAPFSNRRRVTASNPSSSSSVGSCFSSGIPSPRPQAGRWTALESRPCGLTHLVLEPARSGLETDAMRFPATPNRDKPRASRRYRYLQTWRRRSRAAMSGAERAGARRVLIWKKRHLAEPELQDAPDAHLCSAGATLQRTRSKGAHPPPGRSAVRPQRLPRHRDPGAVRGGRARPRGALPPHRQQGGALRGGEHPPGPGDDRDRGGDRGDADLGRGEDPPSVPGADADARGSPGGMDALPAGRDGDRRGGTRAHLRDTRTLRGHLVPASRGGGRERRISGARPHRDQGHPRYAQLRLPLARPGGPPHAGGD